MTTEIPVWRKAINDSSHPMHNIAWNVFRSSFNAEQVAKRFADRREEILPFLYTILDTEELYCEGSLGSGYAPSNAVSLLGAWQVVEAIPRLLTFLEDDHMAIVSDRAAYALEQMPPEAIEPILEYGQQDEDHAMDAMFILSEIGKGDERCFEFICSVFERMSGEFSIITVAERLASNNVEKAEAYFQEKTQRGRFRRYRADFEKIIEEVKSGLWD